MDLPMPSGLTWLHIRNDPLKWQLMLTGISMTYETKYRSWIHNLNIFLVLSCINPEIIYVSRACMKHYMTYIV